MLGVDKIPIQEEYENTLKGDTDLNEKIVKLDEFNELVYENLTLSINTHSSVGKAFGLVRNTKNLEFLERNCKTA